MPYSIKKNYYITTPLYYVNDRPHLGTAYTTLLADILNRYHIFFGQNSFLLTGTDEHGQKSEQAAKKKGLSPLEHCQQMSDRFENVWKKLNIKYDLFFRTSSENHKKAVQTILKILYDKGDIYQAFYKGWYCVSDEIFYTEKDLIDGKSPTGKEVIPLNEKAWFFKMSRYQNLLKKHLKDHPDFIRPLSRQNEIKGFLKQPLQDLCISRPKKRVSWGIELPFDKNCVTYVWLDALCNYITALGYPKINDDMKKYWIEGETVQLIGKDILVTHAVYWTSLLMALDLPLPKTLLAHGWLLNKEQKKMSKSQGDKLDPIELSNSFELDGLRWFLAKEIPLGKDASVSKDLIKQKIDEDLADNLGNIFSRISRLAEKHFKNSPPFSQLKKTDSENSDFLKNITEKTQEHFPKQIENFELSQALESVGQVLREMNRYLEQTAPWKVIKTDVDQASQILYNVFESLRICSILLFPVMPEKMKILLSAMGETALFEKARWGEFNYPKPIEHLQNLFPK